MFELKRSDSSNPDFIELVKHLDAELKIRDGEDHSFFSQYNKIDKIRFVVLAYQDGQPVGCGAIKEYTSNIMEIKRMFVAPSHRGKGIAGNILVELENWAKELAADKCILETGEKQPEAVQLYKKSDYKVIPNYGQYENVKSSICFEKVLV